MPAPDRAASRIPRTSRCTRFGAGVARIVQAGRKPGAAPAGYPRNRAGLRWIPAAGAALAEAPAVRLIPRSRERLEQGLLCGVGAANRREKGVQMPNITVQRPLLPMLATPGAEDPLHMIRELFNWTPLRTLTAPLPHVFAPLFEVRETKDRYVFKADMPGVKEPDLEVNVTGNRLSIIGVRE